MVRSQQLRVLLELGLLAYRVLRKPKLLLTHHCSYHANYQGSL